MNEYKIEKNVPIPEKRTKGLSIKSIALSMSDGDSVFLPADGEKKLYSLACAIRRLDGFTAVQRQVVENGKHGIRVWKVKQHGEQ